MKHAFLWLISPLIKLWQTCKKYVCKHILFKDVTGDGHSDIVIHNDVTLMNEQKSIKKEEKQDDRESN